MSRFHTICQAYEVNWIKNAKVLRSAILEKRRDSVSKPVEIQIYNDLKDLTLATLFLKNDGNNIFQVKGHIKGIVQPFPMFDVGFVVGWHFPTFVITSEQQLLESNQIHFGYRLEKEKIFTFRTFSQEEANSPYKNYGKELIAHDLAKLITDKTFEVYNEYKWLYLMARYVEGYAVGALNLLEELEIEPKRHFHYPPNKIIKLLDLCKHKYYSK